jgi:hypothetical protein
LHQEQGNSAARIREFSLGTANFRASIRELFFPADLKIIFLAFTASCGVMTAIAQQTEMEPAPAAEKKIIRATYWEVLRTSAYIRVSCGAELNNAPAASKPAIAQRQFESPEPAIRRTL